VYPFTAFFGTLSSFILNTWPTPLESSQSDIPGYLLFTCVRFRFCCCTCFAIVLYAAQVHRFS
jgi:hypothetical protein